ncbi:hypothetical protein [Furfurilactobacillus siliginis]|uniref:Amino acid biosynthesis protein n=1 Tax=Furfurilactobacillus siliginis TaxID=348151 RepID=A0A0R2L217_9LACO|nr:hypothetical protein [Furfurilactobacillus siliginis]KRN95763.1 hypothetical protein IV55_GL001868 [Furfurilactobacillus siliginis]GEK28961.1 amino acid biosynthesis protein [Furfurilactobacillus siliginis]
MHIHTLGPAATDSNHASIAYLQQHPELAESVVLHDRFETILRQLAQWPGDLVVIPAAFQSDLWQESWGDVHYAFRDQLTLIDSFVHPLDPLVVVENEQRQTGIGYTHAATGKLLERTVALTQLVTTPSKVAAYQRYQSDGQYVLTNERNVTLTATDSIIKRIEVNMVWCVYRINGGN